MHYVNVNLYNLYTNNTLDVVNSYARIIYDLI